MNKELTQKLVRRFPVIYQGFYDPMSVTCMCWGFDHGDGWFDILWQLSLAIEDELGYTPWQKELFLVKKVWSKIWNKLIYKLSPVRRDETIMEKGADNVWRRTVTKKAEPTWDQYVAWALFGKMKKVGKFEVERLGLKYWAWHPYTGFAVTQVKEKFGTLRYYTGASNDRIDRYINMATMLSAHTCEVCGTDGKLICDGGWYRTVCGNHGMTEENIVL
jgi:hypothetical protein